MNRTRIYSFTGIVLAVLVLITVFVASLDRPPVQIAVHSPYDMQKTIANIRQSLQSNNFRFLREQTLKDGLVSDQNPHFRVLYFCNFAVAYKAIQQDRRVGFMLPCKVTLVEQDGKVTIHYLNPQMVNRLGNKTLDGLCNQIRIALANVVDEATL